MSENNSDTDLNNHNIYVSEALNDFIGKYNRSMPNWDDQNFKTFFNTLFKTCLDCLQSNNQFNKIKLEILKIFLSKNMRFAESYRIQAFRIELILAIAIENQIFGAYNVLNNLRIHDDKEYFLERVNEILDLRLRNKIEFEKTLFFVIDLFTDIDFGSELLTRYIEESTPR